MPKKKVIKKNSKQDDRKLFAFLASFFTLIGFIIALVARKQDKYIMFYAKQGLILFIGAMIIGFWQVIPILGWFTAPILWIGWFILWIITWINALSGQQKQTWLIGELAEKINL